MTIVRTHITHATGAISVEADIPNNDPDSPVRVVRTRFRSGVTFNGRSLDVAALEADLDAQIAKHAGVPTSELASALHRTREAESALALASDEAKKTADKANDAEARLERATAELEATEARIAALLEAEPRAKLER
jgi:hypothetical protein